MTQIDRRAVLRGVTVGSAGLLVPGWARAVSPGLPAQPALSGEAIALTVGHRPFAVGGRTGHAVCVNESVPAPLIRLREGQDVRIAVRNTLDEQTSIHWHGLLVPPQFDGVPGVSFPGIAPGETFTYDLPIRQSGTYWYHSHSGLQEQAALYGPLVIDPAGADPIAFDREHVVLLSDWSFLHPHEIFTRLKQSPAAFNTQRQSLADALGPHPMPLAERLDWAKMRMDPSDISDVTGSTYTYLVNGQAPGDNWTGLFKPGERVRLRFINGSAMTIFNVRIPGLPLTVVAADGQPVRPFETDEFQISVAETFDVIATPTADQAYTLVAEAVDRSGMARGTLAPRAGMAAPVPPLRARPRATMRDMGMDMSAMPGMAMEMSMRDPALAPSVKMGPGVQTIAPMPIDRMGDPGQGLDDAGHRVLRYTDLVALMPNPDTRVPSRALEIHLTGNMDRYMWAFDGTKFAAVTAPIAFRENERVRVTLVNDTMMAHPIHLHGHFFELVTGKGDHAPRKHTINVLPGGKAIFDLTADAVGDWAFHCHLLYHMHAGMFQVVSVRPEAHA